MQPPGDARRQAAGDTVVLVTRSVSSRVGRQAPRAGMSWLRSRPALLATALAFVLVTTGFIAVFFAAPVEAHSSTVTVLDGSVLVSHAGGPFAQIADGDVVDAGDRVRTAADSHGVLTFFDGTTVELEPGTEVTIDDLRASASGDKIVSISQVIGRTWHVVTHLVSPNSRYEVNTPTATAIVRGTAFEVAVAADGTTTTETTEGDVSTIAQGIDVDVRAGQTTSVSPGAAPQAPHPAADPATTVKVTVDPTSNAIVTDADGRAVGVQDGVPIRYVPGSTVALVDGRLVITIPNAQRGVLSTFIRPDPPSFGAAPGTVTVQTEVIVSGAGIVANSLTSRPVEGGTAKGAVVLTATGLLLVPNGDAQNAPAPHIGRRPLGPVSLIPFWTAPMPVVAGAGPNSVGAAKVIDNGTALDVTTAAFVPFQDGGTAPTTVNAGVVTVTTLPGSVFVTPAPGPTLRPTPTPTPSPTPASTLAPVLKTLEPALLIVTPTPTPSPTPTPLPTVVVTTPEPIVIVATPTPTPTPTPIPTRTPSPSPSPTSSLICIPLLTC